MRILVLNVIAVSGLVSVVGCASHYTYPYSGQIISQETGQPLAQKDVLVSQYVPREMSPEMARYYAGQTVATDLDGRYAGHIVGGDARGLFPGAAPSLSQVYFFYKPTNRWISVPLTPDMQSHTSSAERRIDLPTIQVSRQGDPSVRLNP